MEQWSDRKMKSRNRKGGEENMGRRAGLGHMLVSCVNWRSLLLLMFPWRRGIFIGGWHCNEWTHALSHPLILLLLLYICKKMENVSNPRGLQRRHVCMCCVSLPVSVSSHSRESVCRREQIIFMKRKCRQNKRKSRKTGKLPCIEGCNLIWSIY